MITFYGARIPGFSGYGRYLEIVQYLVYGFIIGSWERNLFGLRGYTGGKLKS
jgi:hypothetical protein